MLGPHWGCVKRSIGLIYLCNCLCLFLFLRVAEAYLLHATQNQGKDFMISFGDIEALFQLRDRYKRWRNPEPVVLNTAQRLINLFAVHGVARGQIPRFFGHGLTLHQVESETELMKALTPDLLESAATLFGVRLEWLEGGSEQVYETKHFYQCVAEFGPYLDSLPTSESTSLKFGWLINCPPRNDGYNVLILLAESIGILGNEHIYRYRFCDFWDYGYWKSRADLAACVAQAWRRDWYLNGLIVSWAQFDALASLKCFPGEGEERGLLSGKRWQAEDLTTHPDVFLHGIREGEFGKQSALNRWLEYHQQGLMDSGFGDHGKLFKAQLP
ncbi:hypothetical protein KJI95_10080 [Shewanella sp. JM162201]|uniref:Uncharacterized protein n=1 Tax=Shewanella jiangmenensis TaxID=2837387 RepID=A0ABS5V371_9GAMM|nr:hypothetical protein [Shewanella jiangmenensis]MBT1444870.1 hypothetical protein [Shewanella jiangmenensis]